MFFFTAWQGLFDFEEVNSEPQRKGVQAVHAPVAKYAHTLAPNHP